jgi:hypothetical protein
MSEHSPLTPPAAILGGLQALLEKRQIEAGLAIEDSWILDPSQGVIASIGEDIGVSGYMHWDTGESHFVAAGINAPEFKDEATKIAQLVREVNMNYYSVAGPLIDAGKSADAAEQRTIEILQRRLSSGDQADTSQRWLDVCTIALIAANNKPSGYTGTQVPRKQRAEDHQAKMFRMATGALEQNANRRLSAKETEMAGKMRMGGAMLNALAKYDTKLQHDVESFTASQMFRKTAQRLLSRVLNPEQTREKIDQEYAILLPYVEQLRAEDRAITSGDAKTVETPEISTTNADNEVRPTITFIETGEPMLSPDIGSRPDQQGHPAVERRAPATTEELNAYEQELVSWLAKIAMEWNGTTSARLAVIDLNSSGKRDFIAAILDEYLPDGTKIEHAVAAAPMAAGSNRFEEAVFLFRAEQGIDNGEIWLTWRDVFVGIDKTRKGAQLLGARRMLHTPNLDDRITDVLTRHPTKIEDRRYFLGAA